MCDVCTLLSASSALVNKGNTLFVAQQFEKAREFYQEALRWGYTYDKWWVGQTLLNE